MESRITAYYGLELIPTKNFLIEDMEGFLATKSESIAYSNEHFQYIRPSLSNSIRINAPQGEVFNATQPNYVRIENQDNGIAYYFVTSVSQVAMNTLQLELQLDILNTFANQYRFTNRTHILRKHKDRFMRIDDSFVPVIDRVEEGLQITKFKTRDSVLRQNPDIDWYLKYESDFETENTLSITAVPEQPIDLVGIDGNGFTLSPNTMPRDYALVFGWENNGCYPEGHPLIVLGGQTSAQTSFRYTSFKVTRANGLLNLDAYYTSPGGLTQAERVETARQSITFKSISSIGYAQEDFVYPYPIQPTEVFSTDKSLAGFADTDLTNERLVKIVDLPYAPFTPTNVGNSIAKPDDWEWEFGTLRCSPSLSFSNDLGSSVNPISVSPTSVPVGAKFRTRLGWGRIYEIRTYLQDVDIERSILDPKLWNSDFTQIKAVFDSFAVVVKPECYIAKDTATSNMLFKTMFYPTNTINSKFMFEVVLTNDDWVYASTDDYDVTFLVSRNSEVPIFTNAYLNYIRNGYNYDKKVAAQNATSAWISTGLSFAGSVASAFSGNPFGWVNAVNLGINTLSSTVSNIRSQNQAAEAISQKITELKAQGTSVAGTDDLDLFKRYGENRLHYMVYEPRADVFDMLDDMFYYYGYACNEYGKPFPYTRIWWDFLQCDADIVSLSGNVSPQIIEELKRCYREGVTYFHKYNNTWNTSQFKENWERSLIDEN